MDTVSKFNHYTASTMNSSYTKKLFIYFFLIFAFFTTIILMVQRNREKSYKEENLKHTLNAYIEVIRNSVATTNHINLLNWDTITQVLPHEIRVTIIDHTGNVLYDSDIPNQRELENHMDRPEIRQALVQGKGFRIRYSESKRIDYFYYVDYNGTDFVRVAIPYNKKVQNSLEADDLFTYFILVLFFLAIVTMLYLSDRFSNAITSLNEFVKSIEKKNPNYDKINFPDTELGEIGHRIVKLYKELEEQEQQIQLEREKLIQHFHYSNEGIAIFNANGKKVYANRFFIQYISFILDEPTFEISDLMDNFLFVNFHDFIYRNANLPYSDKHSPMYMEKLTQNGKTFVIKLVIFEDNSYEITLNDITDPERNRALKQEMTNNIAHELRTPVSSIRGYLETLLLQEEITPDKSKQFIEKAYNQTLRLTDLIRDIALITKMEEAPTLFKKESVCINDTVEEVIGELAVGLKSHHIRIKNTLPPHLTIEGNETLIFSIFRNLFENSIKYGGDNITIGLDRYEEDNEYLYLIFYDTGSGVNDEYLEKIFNRFYRVNEGRSRKSGGSGLGLSIVRNAIRFHEGTITAKPHRGGGLEFIFSLKKSNC